MSSLAGGRLFFFCFFRGGEGKLFRPSREASMYAVARGDIIRFRGYKPRRAEIGASNVKRLLRILNTARDSDQK